MIRHTNKYIILTYLLTLKYISLVILLTHNLLNVTSYYHYLICIEIRIYRLELAALSLNTNYNNRPLKVHAKLEYVIIYDQALV